MTGDWEAANLILSQRQELVRFSITENHETALHIAASAQNSKFVEELVKMMAPEDMELQNKSGNTALCLVALSGNKKLAEFLVNQNPRLPLIRGSIKMMPLYMAALYGDRDTVNWVVLKCVEADLFDIALEMMEDIPELARTEEILGVLARKPYAFENREPNFCWRVVKSCFGAPIEEEETEAMELLKMEKFPSRVLFVAAQMGNTKFLVEIIRQYPDLIYKVNDENQTIFHIAISYRHESIYNLLHEIAVKDGLTTIADSEGNNMLHLVGMLSQNTSSRDVSGDIFEMQRELLWFKEVEAMMMFDYRERKNKAGKTPRQLFTETHKGLLSRSEEWIKGTASQCMVVAVLLAGIVFGAAYAVPGGYDQNTGYSMFTHKGAFIAFVISDALSLIFSSISFLFFTSILSSRYCERDFFESLPQKLMVGLTTIFIAILMMMITFSLSFFVLYRSNLIWVPVFVSVVAIATVVLHGRLQRSLLVSLYRSIYGSRYKTFKPKKRVLYIPNPKF
ncbi:hypothetical protein SSX86_032049 [Deinandra increscens subsp. villosa]|uniref:PGG domain-containing protein n=1 Tax=Deinandra increscens subsp. villosa TaxID=3103831 RepID=A0AAP0C8E8_9ASTR